MSGGSERRGIATAQLLPVLASAVLVSLIVVSGVAYAWQTTNNGGDGSSSLALAVIWMGETSGPSYVVFTPVSSLPTSAATFKVGPFAPGDSVVISYIVKNTGSIPASLSTLGVSVSGGGFSTSGGSIPASLNPGVSFSSTITITLNSGLGDSYEGSSATITLKINGASTSTTSSCTNTVTHTTTKTVTVTTTKTVTKTSTAYAGGSALGLGPLWLTTSTCTTLTVTITSTHTTTHTVFTTVTTTVTKTTCARHDKC